MHCRYLSPSYVMHKSRALFSSSLFVPSRDYYLFEKRSSRRSCDAPVSHPCLIHDLQGDFIWQRLRSDIPRESSWELQMFRHPPPPLPGGLTPLLSLPRVWPSRLSRFRFFFAASCVHRLVPIVSFPPTMQRRSFAVDMEISYTRDTRGSISETGTVSPFL